MKGRVGVVGQSRGKDFSFFHRKFFLFYTWRFPLRTTWKMGYNVATQWSTIYHMKSFNGAQEREIAVLFMIQDTVGIGFSLGGDLNAGVSCVGLKSSISLPLFLVQCLVLYYVQYHINLFIQDASRWMLVMDKNICTKLSFGAPHQKKFFPMQCLWAR